MRSSLNISNPLKIPTLSIENVSYCYAAKSILNNIDLEFSSGQFVVVLGANGAGKTTLFSLISTLLKLQTGEIRVCGHSVSSQRTSALANMGLVFQHTTLDMDLTVGQNLSYFAGLQGLNGVEIEARTTDVVHLLDLQNSLGEKVSRLSGGQRRRIEIARALIAEPPLLIMDEATSSLDVSAKTFLCDRMRDLTRETDTTILWSTHLVEEVADQDRVVILDRGKVFDDATCATLCKKYGTSLEALLLKLSQQG